MLKKISLATLSIAALGLSACATIEDKMIEAGASRLDAEQVKDLVVGKTEKWSKGGAFYNPNGTLEAMWEGVPGSGPYTIAEDGNVCYEVKTWDKHCHFYMNDGGEIVSIYKGKKSSAVKLMSGNQLSNL